MELKDRFRKNQNWLIALFMVAGLGIFAGCRFDYYYDLNDDVLMKDILAGVYTGTPEGHNIQMLWLVSALISMFYKVARASLVWAVFMRLPFWLLFPDFEKKSFFCRNLFRKAYSSSYRKPAFYRIISYPSGICPVYGDLHPVRRNGGLSVLYNGYYTFCQGIY